MARNNSKRVAAKATKSVAATGLAKPKSVAATALAKRARKRPRRLDMEEMEARTIDQVARELHLDQEEKLQLQLQVQQQRRQLPSMPDLGEEAPVKERSRKHKSKSEIRKKEKKKEQEKKKLKEKKKKLKAANGKYELSCVLEQWGHKIQFKLDI